ncbi:MAG: serine hydrolase [Bacteroidetes bacterium]|nr:serine hydrolase [Bacteroidota bacterium]
MMKFYISILLLFNSHWLTAQINTNLATKLQDTLTLMGNMLSASTQGISAGIYVPGQGYWQGVSGVSHPGQPMKSGMELGLASNSKLFVAVAMLKLAQGGTISLNDSLSKWIPNYPNVKPFITIRQLLNHTSGIADPFLDSTLLDTVKKYPNKLYTPNEVLAWTGLQKNNPGAGYHYSNVNYILAGMIAKNATGNHISKVIRDSILTPLNMDSTFYDVEEAAVGTLAHRWDNGIDLHDTSRISVNSSGGPAGSLFSTSREMAQWFNALMSGQVLNANSFNELTNFLLPGNYGLGLQKTIFFGRTTWGHGGSTIGYKSRTIYDPCMKTTVIGLSNGDYSAVDGITAILYRVLTELLPNCPGNIAGATSVCQGQNSVTYTVPPILNANTYIWTLPTGATGVSTTNSITVNYGLAAVSGNITVKGNSNTYGPGTENSLFITVKPRKTSSFNQTICSNQTYVWNGINRNSTGAFLDTFATFQGCDSVVTLNLTVNQTTAGSFNQAICSNQSYFFNGANRNVSGPYLDTLVNAKGCDSFLTLNLTVNTSTAGSFNQTICANQSYFFNGANRNVSGPYLDTLLNAKGCDSILTLNLTVNPTSVGSFNKTICSNQFYFFNGANRNASGPYLDTLVNAKGCDSFLTLNLTVANFFSTSLNQTICSNQSYSWNGAARTIAGAYLDSFTSISGCDSFVTLNLFINPTSSNSFNKTICANQGYFFNGANRNIAGAYLDTLINSKGCDSIVTLNLTVTPLPNKTITVLNNTITAVLAGANYQWVNCLTNIGITGAINQSYTATANGSYKVAISQNGCSDTSICAPISMSGISNFTQISIEIFPNPSQESFKIKADESGEYTIVNGLGQVMRSFHLNADNYNTIEIKDIEPGIYFVKQWGEQSSKGNKIVVVGK